jgi:peptidyl-dipeptidase A
MKIYNIKPGRYSLTICCFNFRNEIEGLVPPVMRSEADFDAGAKYHVPGNTPYIRYFVSFIIQFQIHKELCIAAGQYNETNPDPGNPLYNCDIDGSVEAGDIMRYANYC